MDRTLELRKDNYSSKSASRAYSIGLHPRALGRLSRGDKLSIVVEVNRMAFHFSGCNAQSCGHVVLRKSYKALEVIPINDPMIPTGYDLGGGGIMLETCDMFLSRHYQALPAGDATQVPTISTI